MVAEAQMGENEPSNPKLIKPDELALYPVESAVSGRRVHGPTKENPVFGAPTRSTHRILLDIGLNPQRLGESDRN